MKGKIFDVTAGAAHYGPGSGYNGFVGRDASRSFMDLCFTPECLAKADDLEGLTAKQLKSINDWEDFYFNDPKYPFVGYVKKAKKRSVKE